MSLVPSVFHDPILVLSALGVAYSTGPAGVAPHGFIAAFETRFKGKGKGKATAGLVRRNGDPTGMACGN
jgi:hypothetical protein